VLIVPFKIRRLFSYRTIEKETSQHTGEAPVLQCGERAVTRLFTLFTSRFFHPNWIRVGRGQLISSIILYDSFWYGQWLPKV